MFGFWCKIPLTWIFQGYPHFRKPPNSLLFAFLCDSNNQTVGIRQWLLVLPAVSRWPLADDVLATSPAIECAKMSKNAKAHCRRKDTPKFKIYLFVNLASWATTARQCSWIHVLLLKSIHVYSRWLKLRTQPWIRTMLELFDPLKRYKQVILGVQKPQPQSSSHWQPTLPQRKLVSAVPLAQQSLKKIWRSSSVPTGSRIPGEDRFGWFHLR